MRGLTKKVANKRYGIHARLKRMRQLELRRGPLRWRKASARRNAELQDVEMQLFNLRAAHTKDVQECEALSQQIARAPVRDTMRVIPVKNIALRVSKFDVVLRQAPLRAAHVMPTL